jgi:two-component system chemotaxis response regulator CheY
LIAEDDLVSRCLLEELLTGWGHEVLVEEDGEAALAVVQRRERFDVAILDWMMPGVAGVTVCKRIRDLGGERHPYVLMLTAKSQLEDVVGGLDAGADEYLTKPYRPAELAARLRAAERFLRVQDDLIGARRLVAYQSEHDILTGALNRATLLSRLHAMLVERHRRPAPLSVLRVDIAGFSRINERYGIGVGDEIVRAVLERVRSQLPLGIVAGRNGPDEFLVVLPEGEPAQAGVLAAAVAEGVEAAPFSTQAGMVAVAVDVVVATAVGRAELDLGWLLSALDARAAQRAPRYQSSTDLALAG